MGLLLCACAPPCLQTFRWRRRRCKIWRRFNPWIFHGGSLPVFAPPKLLFRAMHLGLLLRVRFSCRRACVFRTELVVGWGSVASVPLPRQYIVYREPHAAEVPKLREIPAVYFAPSAVDSGATIWCSRGKDRLMSKSAKLTSFSLQTTKKHLYMLCTCACTRTW